MRSVTGSAACGRDDFGQPRGDVVEAAGVDRDVVAAAVDLHARPVELGLENRFTAEAFEGVVHTGRGLGEHRADRPPDPQGELVEGRRPAGQRRRRNRGQVAAEHGGAAHRGGRDAGRLGDGVGHHPAQRALPQFAAEQPAQEHLLGLGRGGEQPAEQVGPPRLRSLAGDGADVGERRIDRRHRQRG